MHLIAVPDGMAVLTPRVGVTGHRFEHFVIAKVTRSGSVRNLDVKRGED